MITSSDTRIASLRASGAWSGETLHGLLAEHAVSSSDKMAVSDQPNRHALTGDAPLVLTWMELHEAAISLALQLQNKGLNCGDRVIVQMPNVVELVVCYYACSQLGIIISPVPVQYGRHELELIAQALEPSAVLTIEQFRDQSLAANAREALPKTPVMAFGKELFLHGDAGSKRSIAVASDANRVLSLCWTSGTTGTPKGVPRSHNMWLATARATIAAGDYRSDDILLNPFPMVNMAALGGFLFPAALLGCSIVLHHPLDPPLFLQQLQDQKVSFTIAPPALLNQLAKSSELWNQFDFSALRCVGSGSAPLSPWMIETFARDYGKEVVNFYGSNEGISLFATPASAPDPTIRASMFPCPEPGSIIETRVLNAECGKIVSEEGERGELMISGPTVFDGYFKHGDSEVFDKDGFFHTGDLVEIVGRDKQYYRIVGRCKDIINRGGMKISPAELDVALEQHPQLVEAAVCAYADDRLGEKICACVVMKAEEKPLTIESVQAFLLEQGFAKFKLPERIVLLEQLPRNPPGKVQRFVLEDIVANCKKG